MNSSLKRAMSFLDVPHSTPYGLIMKLHAEPLEGGIPEDLIAQDFAYWEELIEELVARPEYHRDEMAPRTFAKLRSSMGGLYLYWANRLREGRMYEYAERALRESLELYRPLPEANYRLAELLVQLDRQEDALAVIDGYWEEDPMNARSLRFGKGSRPFQRSCGTRRNVCWRGWRVSWRMWRGCSRWLGSMGCATCSLKPTPRSIDFEAAYR